MSATNGGAAPSRPKRTAFILGSSHDPLRTDGIGARADVLVNNAGVTRDGMLRKMTSEQWHIVIETNLNSLFHVTKQVIEDMLDRGWGRIINISSVNGQKGPIGQTNYSTAKAGIHGFTMALVQEVSRHSLLRPRLLPGRPPSPSPPVRDVKAGLAGWP